MRPTNLDRTHTMTRPAFAHFSRSALPGLALAALLMAGPTAPAAAADSLFVLSGTTDSFGPLPDLAFQGQFAYDSSAVADGFSGDIALSSFSLHFAGQTYDLASADAGTMPLASFAAGQFLGIGYVDADASDSAQRPHLTLVPGFFTLADDAYLAYEVAGLGGYGSYSVSAVPEPASLALLLGGLGLLGAAHRRRRLAG